MDELSTTDFFLPEPQDRHPLADPAQARELLESLPANEPLTLLAQASAWLHEIIALPEVDLPHLLAFVDSVEALARPHQFHLLPQYLGAPRQMKLSENKLWATSFEFSKALGSAYFNCLERYQAAQGDLKSFHAQLPLVSCRVLRGLTQQLKWSLFRYAPVEDRIWRDMTRTFQLAEGWGFSSRPCRVYPGPHGESSPQEELLKALMLSISAPDALSPLKQNLAERIIAYLRHRFAFHSTPGPGCMFCFDLSMHRPPTRARKSATAAATLRFFGQGTAGEGLAELAAHIRQHGKPPTGSGLGENLDTQVLQAVISHLARCWSDSPVARRGPRVPAFMRFTIVPGFGEALGWLDENRAEAIHADNWESWVVFDVSVHGCGAQLGASLPPWLMVGALLGARSETSPERRMGIVRRISPDADGSYRVGIEFPGAAALPVRLEPAQSGDDGQRSREGRRAILLDRKSSADGSIRLLLAPGDFNYVHNLHLRWKDQVYPVTFTQVLERGTDYKLAVFHLKKADKGGASEA